MKKRIVTWPDGTVSIRRVERDKHGTLTNINYKNNSGNFHRTDGGPAGIGFIGGILELVMWVEKGAMSQTRLEAGLPSVWQDSVFFWEHENHYGIHNLAGIARLSETGGEHWINNKYVTENEFKQQYLITHLEEYIETDPRLLYKELYEDMMAHINKEMSDV